VPKGQAAALLGTGQPPRCGGNDVFGLGETRNFDALVRDRMKFGGAGSSTWPSRPPDFPLGDSLEVFICREDAERFIEEVRDDEPQLASYLRIEERELEAGGLN
jgi:hypothetical protein